MKPTKNSLNIVKKSVAYIFITSIVLISISCNGSKHLSMNGHTESNTTAYKASCPSLEKRHEVLCPFCKASCRHLYTLTGSKDSIILFCNGCLNIWLDPNDIQWSGVIPSEKILEEKFGCDLDSLFEDPKGHWTEKAEAKNSPWKNRVKANEFFLFPEKR
ncbi:MAG: hypothetical protein ACYC2U_05695 [Candidatus Amoebophilus sp.]